MNGLLTVNQAAEILKVDPETIRKWLRQGKLKGDKLGGDPHNPGRREWRIRWEDLEAFKAGTGPAHADASKKIASGTDSRPAGPSSSMRD